MVIACHLAEKSVFELDLNVTLIELLWVDQGRAVWCWHSTRVSTGTSAGSLDFLLWTVLIDDIKIKSADCPWISLLDW